MRQQLISMFFFLANIFLFDPLSIRIEVLNGLHLVFSLGKRLLKTDSVSIFDFQIWLKRKVTSKSTKSADGLWLVLMLILVVNGTGTDCIFMPHYLFSFNFYLLGLATSATSHKLKLNTHTQTHIQAQTTNISYRRAWDDDDGESCLWLTQLSFLLLLLLQLLLLLLLLFPPVYMPAIALPLRSLHKNIYVYFRLFAFNCRY